MKSLLSSSGGGRGGEGAIQQSHPVPECGSDVERYAAYLPRNLSDCALCFQALKDHLARKVLLLDRCLADLRLQGDSQSGEVSVSSPKEDDWKNPNTGSRRPSSILRANFRRATSLPPDGRRRTTGKSVHFSDTQGLDLETVRHILFSERPPRIPTSAFRDLRPTSPLPVLQLEAEFPDPWTLPDRDVRLQGQGILLVRVRTVPLCSGVIAVLNITHPKRVSVRYTLDQWRTHREIPATYLQPGPPTAGGASTDHFRFSIFAGVSDFRESADETSRVRLTFALRYRTRDGRELWDNNLGRNYSLSGSSSDLLPYDAALGHAWVHFI